MKFSQRLGLATGRARRYSARRRMVLNEGFLYGTNEVVIQCVLLALMLIAVEIGFRLGRKAEANTRPETKAQIAIVEGALLGVLALLLGFTMSMAASRFETRKQLV